MLPDTQPNLLSKEDFLFGKNLLKRFIESEISSEEFYKEVTYFALQSGFEELRYRPLPTRPNELYEYDNLTETQKEKVGNDFWKQPVIASYLNQKGQVKGTNYSNKAWLKTLLERFDKDTINAEKVREKLKEYPETVR